MKKRSWKVSARFNGSYRIWCLLCCMVHRSLRGLSDSITDQLQNRDLSFGGDSERIGVSGRSFKVRFQLKPSGSDLLSGTAAECKTSKASQIMSQETHWKMHCFCIILISFQPYETSFQLFKPRSQILFLNSSKWFLHSFSLNGKEIIVLDGIQFTILLIYLLNYYYSLIFIYFIQIIIFLQTNLV